MDVRTLPGRSDDLSTEHAWTKGRNMEDNHDDYISETQRSAARSAVAIRAQFLALKAVGFSDDESMELVEAMMANAVRRDE